MSDDEATTVFAADSSEKVQTAIESLSSIVPSLSITTPTSFLSNPEIYSQISSLLRRPNFGAGDNNLCRWLYDTFQSGVTELQLLVLCFLPVIAGIYLSRVADRKPQAGFEAILLAVYAHETTSRPGQAVSITIPDLAQPSLYHDPKELTPNNKNINSSTELNVTVMSPSLKPHGIVRSTRRARIVGVALELYYAKISHMPMSSKIDFCEFCKLWAGQDGDMYKNIEEEDKGERSLEEESVVFVDASAGLKEKEKGKVEYRIPLPWELLEPVLRILGHCLLGPNNMDMELFGAASKACRCLFARSLHDVNSKAILPIRSLLRLSKTLVQNNNEVDPTQLPFTDVISL